MAAQTTRRFRWLVLVDPRTPEPFRHRTEEALRKTGVEHELVEIKRWDEVRRAVAERASEGTLTTRLDNDDAISREHIASVRKAIERGARSVQFVSGVVLFVDTGRAYRLRQRHSPFYSMLYTDGVTAATLEQGVVREAAPPTVELEMGFLRVLHGRNLVGTHGSLGRRIASEAVLQRFPIRPDLLAQDRPSDYYRDAAMSFARDTVHSVRRGLWHLRRALRD